MFLGNVEKSRVRRIYKEFVGDSTADEMEIDIRVKLAFDLRDPDIITDLRHFNEGRISIYDTFWEYSKKFLEGTAQDSVVAVDERRHDPIVHLARAISLKFMIQIRQLHMDHIDSHYASAIFRYLKELAIKFKDNTWLVFLDDKHRCKIGEPGHPVAAIERGKQVVVTTHETFAVSDHDFTKCSLIPSVTMIEKHHPFLMLYTDGGPDHKITFLRVQLSLIAMFIALDLDYLVAVRTPPGHSWKNPVERIMSILNLGMQCVGLMRQKMSEEMEKLINGCNSLEDIREKAKINNKLEEELLQSMEPTRDLLSSIFTRQNLKDEPFKMFKPATKTEMETFWESVHLVDDSITMDDTSQKKVADKPKLQEFMEHCCRKRLYFFEIKKCGSSECDICRPIRSDINVFKELKGLPDPIPGPDDHYISFLEAYEKETTEEYCPSLRNRKPRVLYARHKISEEEFRLLQSFLESIEYTCGVTFKGLSELSSSYCKECHVSAGEKRKIGKRKYFDGGNKNSRKKRKIGN